MKARERANRFRTELLALHQLPDHDWNDWELDWLDSELFRRPALYEPSEKEAAVLARMRRNTTQFAGWDGYSVLELIKSPRRDDIAAPGDGTACPTMSRRWYSIGPVRSGAGRGVGRDPPQSSNQR